MQKYIYSAILFPISHNNYVIFPDKGGSAMMAKLQMELVRMKKAILKANAHRLAPQICEQIR